MSPSRTAATAPWYQRAGLEARNVVVTTLAALVVVALLIGAVILVTAIVAR